MIEHDALGWFTGRLPEGWFAGPPEIVVDRDEVLVLGTLPPLEDVGDGDDTARRAAEEGRIKRFRETSRVERMAIAHEAGERYRRHIAWGARAGETTQLFTTVSVPVMTRLRQPERRVLDTLVDAGVARSRSDALAWCVRLVGQHQEEWIDSLRAALVAVEEARRRGPDV